MKTLYLTNQWDLTLDEFGNIATKEGNNQIAQDVASSVRVFKGEMLFDKERGISYNEPDKERETLSFDLTREAKRINGVVDALAVMNSLEQRELNTTVYIETDNGEVLNVSNNNG
jgi:hypothetical protein